MQICTAVDNDWQFMAQPHYKRSTVEYGVGPHDAHDFPRAVTVLKLYVLMIEVQISC